MRQEGDLQYRVVAPHAHASGQSLPHNLSLESVLGYPAHPQKDPSMLMRVRGQGAVFVTVMTDRRRLPASNGVKNVRLTIHEVRHQIVVMNMHKSMNAFELGHGAEVGIVLALPLAQVQPSRSAAESP